MKSLQEWIEFKANCMMVLQHISCMDFEINGDNITIKYNGLCGEYKSKDLPKKQKELLQKSIDDVFYLDQSDIKNALHQYVLTVLQEEAKEYMGIIDDLKSFIKQN